MFWRGVTGALAVSSHGAAAASSTTLTLHARRCPLGQPTTDIFTDCHGHPASSKNTYSVDGGASKQVNASGNVGFTVGAGGHTVTQTGGQFTNELLHERIYCSRNGGAAKVLSVGADSRFAITLKAGDQAVCDLYYIPESG